MTRHSFLAACAIAATSTAAFAQGTMQQGAPSAADPARQQEQMQNQQQMQQMRQQQTKFYQPKPDDAVVSNWTGLNVYNPQDESIGEIKDVIVDANNQLRAVVVGVGGFLGIGGRYVAVDPQSIRFSAAGSGGTRAYINMTRDALSNAPEFKYENQFARGQTGSSTTTGSAPAQSQTGAPSR